MKRRTYTRDDLLVRLLAFEEEYGMTSAVFYEAHRQEDDANDALSDIPGFSRHLWASFYRDWKRMAA